MLTVFMTVACDGQDIPSANMHTIQIVIIFRMIEELDAGLL